VCLCLVLLGVPFVLGACAGLENNVISPSYTPNGSSQYPYPVTVSKGKCMAWSIVFDNGVGGPLCAQALPIQHVGMYMQLSYNGISQTVRLVSLDARRQVARVQ
jgi:hypothetical protein